MAENLVALRDHRELVIARLSEGYAADVFDMDELERRLDLAHGAGTVAELDALIADLGPRVDSKALVVAAPRAIDDPNRVARKKQRVIMSSNERRGRWSVPRELDLRVFWGHSELDFREASIGPGVTTIDVSVLMGNIEIVLPPNMAVDVDVSSFMGNVTERHRVPPDDDPARPLLRITGTVKLGNLEITTRLRGESHGDARRRERRERRALRSEQRKMLPPGS